MTQVRQTWVICVHWDSFILDLDLQYIEKLRPARYADKASACKIVKRSMQNIGRSRKRRSKWMQGKGRQTTAWTEALAWLSCTETLRTIYSNTYCMFDPAGHKRFKRGPSLSLCSLSLSRCSKSSDRIFVDGKIYAKWHPRMWLLVQRQGYVSRQPAGVLHPPWRLSIAKLAQMLRL